MKNKIPPSILVLLIAIILSAISFILLWSQIININENDITFHFPVSRFEILIFLAGPLLMLAPFLLAITILGSYFITKLWMKDVIINIVTETYEKTATISITKNLTPEDKLVLNILIKNQPKMIQSDLVKESKLPKHKITRILNRLEQYDLITREKYGITNTIFLKINKEVLDKI